MEIDDEDFDKIKDLNLTLNHQSNPNTKYAKSIVYKNCKYVKKLHVHRIIMGLGDFKEDKRIIHHIDGNGLNNKKCNLEICDQMYNSQSIRHKNKDYNYVSYRYEVNRVKCWTFQTTINKKRHRKRFETEKEANAYRDMFLASL